MNQNLIAVCKRELMDIYECALAAIKPDQLVRSACSFEEGNLTIQDVNNTSDKSDNRTKLKYPLENRRLHVIGGGKCALAMASGLAQLAKQSALTPGVFSHGCLSVPIMLRETYSRDSQLQESLKLLDIECRFGSKDNLPDEDSVAATKFMFDRIAEACRQDELLNLGSLFITILSGGGSACLSSPRHVDLAKKTAITRELAQRGANIVELNKVRRCLSHVKGGNLARHIARCNPAAQVLSLIISDVVGDPIEFIASGPTHMESAETEAEIRSRLQSDMAEIMTKYHLNIPPLGRVEPEVVDGRRRRLLPQLGGGGDFVTNRVIGNNLVAMRAAIERARELNYRVHTLGNSLSGDTAEVARKMLAACEAHRSSPQGGKLLIIGGGETTVRLLEGESWGLGGRTQETALDYMIAQLSLSRQTFELERPQAQSVIDVFLAGSTDGQDGPTEVAACLASRAEWRADSFSLASALEAKRRHDSFNFWTRWRPDWLVKSGATGSNVMDLYLLTNCACVVAERQA